MQTLVKTLQQNLHLKAKSYAIDNLFFKLHYRFTTILLFLMTALITSQELIGEHIKCMSDKGVDPQDKDKKNNLLNTYCYFMSTFTVVKNLKANGDIYPGIGQYTNEQPIKHHAYYQWVPFVLFAQAVVFYIPHLIWKMNEGDRLRKLVDGLQDAVFATDKPFKIGNKETPTKEFIYRKFVELKLVFKNHLLVNRSWTRWLISCEILNFVNTILQIYVTHRFLGKTFLTLGFDIFMDDDYDALDIVFPKMTKCVFHKFGPSGSIQAFDALCVMPLNIINEKIFVFLWFWYFLLIITSVMALLWRFLSICLYSRSIRFNRYLFSRNAPGKVQRWKILVLMKYCNYEDWLFLMYMSKNMDTLVFRNFLTHLALDLDEQTILIRAVDYGANKSE